MTVKVKTVDGKVDEHFSADRVEFPGEWSTIVEGNNDFMRVMSDEETLRTYLTDNVVWFEE